MGLRGGEFFSDGNRLLHQLVGFFQVRLARVLSTERRFHPTFDRQPSTLSGRLFRGRFVDCVDISTHGGENYIITGLTAEGFRESGLWPKPADLSDALTEVLRREIEATATSDPRRSRKLQDILDYASEFGSSFLAKLGAEILKNLERH